MTIKKISGKAALKVKGTTDWKAFDDLTDEQIKESAKEDPDSAHLSEDELKEFKKLSTPPTEKKKP